MASKQYEGRDFELDSNGATPYGRGVRPVGELMKIEASEKTLGEILSAFYYDIPDFQRPYSWLVENVQEFWRDSIEQESGDYFIGSMVVFKKTGTTSTYGIVDGQQRLTTVTMILAAVRNAFKAEGEEELAQGVHQSIERKDRDNVPQHVLSAQATYPYFQEHIQKFGTPDAGKVAGLEEKSLEQAFKEVTSLVQLAVSAIKDDSTIGDEDKPKRLRQKLVQIRDRLLGLKLIFIILDSVEDAITIFETLNTRGQDLTVADLVKSHFVRNIKSKTKGIAVYKWRELQKVIEGHRELSIDVFLHHFWLSTFDYITKKALFKQFRKEVKEANALHFLNWLIAEGTTYREMHETTFRKWTAHEQKIQDCLDALSLYKVRQQIPMVLSVMRDYKKDNIKKKDVERALVPIANFHYSFTAITSQRSSGGISQMFAKAARALYAEADREKKLKLIDDLVEKLKEKVPSYDEFKANFQSILCTNEITKQKDLVKHTLSRVDAHVRRDATIKYGLMTMEHLAAQSAQTEQSQLDEEHYGQFGNLILVPPELNNKLGNKPIAEKKKLLTEAGVPLDDVIKNATEWGPEQIVKRTEALSELCYKKVFKI
jgi:hypothetical protein